jgi:nicotinamidase-related amidase
MLGGIGHALVSAVKEAVFFHCLACVTWTIDDLLSAIRAQDPTLAQKIYLLTDCTSRGGIPRMVDFTDQANEAFDRFAAAGMRLVKSTDALEMGLGFLP